MLKNANLLLTFGFECDIISESLERAQQMARQFSWLERQPVTLEVDGSSPFRVANYASVAQLVEQGTENPRVIGSIPIGGTICGRSSSGRAPPCQGGGSEFEPRRPLQYGDIAKW